jgi:hypothetical protein
MRKIMFPYFAKASDVVSRLWLFIIGICELLRGVLVVASFGFVEWPDLTMWAQGKYLDHEFAVETKRMKNDK